MQSSKTSKDWEQDLYIVYLQNEYDTTMEFSVFLEYCKGYSYVENILGYKWSEVKDEVS